jgi:hypothetical protein
MEVVPAIRSIAQVMSGRLGEHFSLLYPTQRKVKRQGVSSGGHGEPEMVRNWTLAWDILDSFVGSLALETSRCFEWDWDGFLEGGLAGIFGILGLPEKAVSKNPQLDFSQ